MGLTHFVRGCVTGVTLLLCMSSRLANSPQLVAGAFCCAISAVSAAEPAEPKRTFNLPRGDAATTLSEFGGASGRTIIFMMDKVRGEQTNAIAGEYSPREALERMLAGTALIARQDSKSGAFVVSRSNSSPPSESRPPDSSKQPPKVMKRKNPIALFAAGLALTVAPATTSQSAQADQATGAGGQAASSQQTLIGTVTNSATGRALEGARVVLQGTGREMLTNGQGIYRFDNLAPGGVVLKVSYTGLNTVDIPVDVKPGIRNQADVGLTSDIYTLGEFVVSGEREGNAQAVTLQRLSIGVKSVVSTDAFGSLAGNPVDLLVRLPGVEGVTSGGDFRYVRIRGMHYNLNTVTMDGNRIADASGSDTREVQFQTVGSDTVERMEVIKSPTPDMDADSIGGAVNLVSKSAFDSSPERRIRASVGANWRPFDDRSKTSAPLNYSLSYSEVFGGKLAVAVNAAYRPHFGPIDRTNQTHQLLPADVAGPAYTYNFQIEDRRLNRTRTGGGVRLDYKLSDSTRFFVNTTHDKFTATNYNTPVLFTTAQTIATLDASGRPTGNGAIVPGFTDTFTEIRPIPASRLTITSFTNDKNGTTTHIQLGAVHRYQGIDIDYDVYKSASKSFYPGNRRIEYTIRNLGFTISKSGDKYFPDVAVTSGPDITNLASYTDNSYLIERETAWDIYRGASLSAKKSFRTAFPSYLKAGGRLREQSRRIQNSTYSTVYVGPDGVMGINPATGQNDDNLAQFGQSGRGDPGTELSRYPVFPFPAFHGTEGGPIDRALEQTPQYFRESIAANVASGLTGNQDFKETIDAYYLMGHVDFGKLSLLAGARIESTKVEAEGALVTVTPEERARRAAWVGPVTEEELRRRTIAENSGRLRSKGEYRDVFPGAHLKYEVLPKLITRFSYSTNIGRPSIGQLIPRTSVNYENSSVSSSNPGLKSQYANNYDLSAEYYFEPAGVVSAAVFMKDIKRFIYTDGGAVIGEGAGNGFNGEYAGFAYTTQYNGGSAKIKGLELNYSQQFTFLPGFWNGLGAYANYTRLEAEGNYGTGGAISLTPTSEVPGFNPENANLGISYIKNRISLRFQMNYRGRYLSTYNANRSRLQYTMPRTILDTKMTYRISRQFECYLDILNVLNKPDMRIEYYGGRPGAQHLMSPQVFFGVTARL